MLKFLFSANSRYVSAYPKYDFAVLLFQLQLLFSVSPKHIFSVRPLWLALWFWVWEQRKQRYPLLFSEQFRSVFA